MKNWKSLIIKLSKKQNEVIKKMRNGCEVYYLTGLDVSGWINNGKTSEVLSIATIFSLENKKLIERDEGDFRSVDYKLTELGKTCLLF